MTTESAPQNKFLTLLQNPSILHNLIDKLGFPGPTPIQEASIPSILEGRDLYAGAKTGSGKTIAFIAPIAQMLMEGKIQRALVLCPTRELALQTDDEAMKILDGQTQFVSMPLYGGVPLDQQLRALKANKPRLYIATPGRMIDFMMEELLDLDSIEIAVLDEADRMCDMGFSPQIIQILSSLKKLKQTLMFSATLPKEANDIMERFLKEPVRIQIDNPQESSSTIEHRAIFVSRRDKTRRIKDLLQEPNQVTVIFCRTRKGADRLYQDLSKEMDNIGILHAGFEMNERERTIRAFKDRKINTLIATDVASRGLDVEQVTQVIHYELPETVEDYIHRSGRSGRAGREGLSTALIDKDSFNERRQLEQITKKISVKIVGKAEEASSHSTKESRRGEHPEGRRDRGPRERNQQSRGRGRSHDRRPREDRRPDERPRGDRKPRATSPRTTVAKPEAKKSSGILKKAKKVIGSLFKKKKS